MVNRFRSPMVISIAIFGALSAAAFIAGLLLDVQWLRTITKPLPVLSMLLAVALTQRHLTATLIAVGLALSAVGDIVLEHPFSLFVAGLVAFLFGHVAYIVAFIREAPRLKPGRAVVPMIFWATAFVVLHPHLGEMVVPVAVYLLVICGMLWRAGAMAATAQNRETTFALIGAFLFVASDTVLALNRFRAPIDGAQYIIIVLYWLGQLGITLSAFRRKEPHDA